MAHNLSLIDLKSWIPTRPRPLESCNSPRSFIQANLNIAYVISSPSPYNHNITRSCLDFINLLPG